MVLESLPLHWQSLNQTSQWGVLFLSYFSLNHLVYPASVSPCEKAELLILKVDEKDLFS